MSKRLDCIIDGCDASIEGETADDIMSQAQTHAASAHPDLNLDDDTVAAIRGAIVDA